MKKCTSFLGNVGTVVFMLTVGFFCDLLISSLFRANPFDWYGIALWLFMSLVAGFPLDYFGDRHGYLSLLMSAAVLSLIATATFTDRVATLYLFASAAPLIVRGFGRAVLRIY